MIFIKKEIITHMSQQIIDQGVEDNSNYFEYSDLLEDLSDEGINARFELLKEEQNRTVKNLIDISLELLALMYKRGLK